MSLSPPSSRVSRKPGVDQQPTVSWQTYQDRPGGRGLGLAPASIAGPDVRVLAERETSAPSQGTLPATGVGRWTLAGALGLALALCVRVAARSVPRRR